MVKVYKTNVNKRSAATSILDAIRRKFPNSKPSFDLEDCDKVLRIELSSPDVNEQKIRGIIRDFGYIIETLP